MGGWIDGLDITCPLRRAISNIHSQRSIRSSIPFVDVWIVCINRIVWVVGLDGWVNRCMDGLCMVEWMGGRMVLTYPFILASIPLSTHPSRHLSILESTHSLIDRAKLAIHMSVHRSNLDHLCVHPCIHQIDQIQILTGGWMQGCMDRLGMCIDRSIFPPIHSATQSPPISSRPSVDGSVPYRFSPEQTHSDHLIHIHVSD